MVSISHRRLFLGLGTGTLSTALTVVIFPETVLTELIAPFSLLLTLAVPGILLYLSLTRSRDVNHRTVTYGFGLSASLLMLLGFLLNLPYRVAGIDSLTPLFVWLSFGALLLLLYYAVQSRVPSNSIEIGLPLSLRPYLYLSLPVASGIGSILVGGGETNVIVLLALGAIVLVYSIGTFDTSNKGTLLYCVALGLLLHNSLITDALVWGDQAAESGLVYTVLQVGHWDPATLPSANKAVMLRIVIHHPMQVLLTGLDISHIFKISHPLMFAVTPVALYYVFADRNQTLVGYIAAGAFMMYFPFITVLARNTRTGAAIMFIVLFLYALLDNHTPATVRRILLSVFGISVFVSHYGTGYMFLTILVTAFLLVQFGRRTFKRIDSRQQQLPAVPLLIISLVSMAWYTYISPNSATLRTLSGFVLELVEKLQQGFFQPSSSSTASYATESYSSLSLSGIKGLTVVLFALIGIGWLVAAFRAWRGEECVYGVESNLSYLSIAAVAGALVAVTFLPISKFNTARTTAVVLAIVSPLFAIGIQSVLKLTLKEISFPNWVTPLACLTIIIPFFIFSTGLLAATVTHDYSPNVLVYQNEIIDDGSPSAKSYLFKQHIPPTETHAARWLGDYATGEIFGSQWPGTPDPGSLFHRTKSTSYSYTANVSAASAGDCIYFDPISERANVVLLPSGPIDDVLLSASEVDTSTRAQVYENGGASLYC